MYFCMSIWEVIHDQRLSQILRSFKDSGLFLCYFFSSSSDFPDALLIQLIFTFNLFQPLINPRSGNTCSFMDCCNPSSAVSNITGFCSGCTPQANSTFIQKTGYKKKFLIITDFGEDCNSLKLLWPKILILSDFSGIRAVNELSDSIQFLGIWIKSYKYKEVIKKYT